MGLLLNKEKKAAANKKKKLPKTVQQSIPYEAVYENGVFRDSDNMFTKMYRLEDVNFKIASDEEQEKLFLLYEAFLNTFPTNVRVQVLIYNQTADKRQFIKTVRFEPQRDGLNSLRSEMNDMLINKVAAGKNNLQQDKFVIVGYQDNDTESAMRVLDSLDKDVDSALSKISPQSKAHAVSLEERLRILHSIYNQNESAVFGNVKNKDGSTSLDIGLLYKNGLSTKDAIAPGAIAFKPNHFQIGDTFGCSLFLANVPNSLSTDFMADITNLPFCQLVSVNYQPIEGTKALKMVRDRLMAINVQIAAQQKRAAEEGYSEAVASPELYASQEKTMELLNDITSRDQKLFFATFTISVFASSLRVLEEAVRQITAIGNRYIVPLKRLLYQQEFGFNSTLPFCQNELFVHRLMTTESASVFIPYTSQELFQKNGTYYGTNELTKSVIMYSRMTGNNYNGLIFGEAGTGKSFSAKSEMLNVALRSDKNQIYVIDPEGEYSDIARALGGEVVELSTSSTTFINPLDMDLDYGGDSNPVAMKSDYIISMVEIMLGGGQSLDAIYRSIVDRCVRIMYRGYVEHLEDLNRKGNKITCDRDASPTLMDLYQILREQGEEEAQLLATVIEPYAKGGMMLFAHRTNIQTTSRFVVYNIKNLGRGMKDLGLHVCLNEIWNQMIANRKKDIWTWFYIDEFYLLLQSEGTAAFLKEIWKRARKWNGVPTGIMQNTEDLMRSADGRNILNNTSFIIMMSALQMDRQNFGELLNISPSQLEYINNAERGHGIIYTGKTIIPFNNEYAKDTKLYEIMSTSGTQDAVNSSF